MRPAAVALLRRIEYYPPSCLGRHRLGRECHLEGRSGATAVDASSLRRLSVAFSDECYRLGNSRGPETLSKIQ